MKQESTERMEDHMIKTSWGTSNFHGGTGINTLSGRHSISSNDENSQAQNAVESLSSLHFMYDIPSDCSL